MAARPTLRRMSHGREDAGTPLGKTLPGTKLALMQQTFNLAGETYRLVVPCEADAVIDHCLASGAQLAQHSTRFTCSIGCRGMFRAGLGKEAELRHVMRQCIEYVQLA